MSDSGKGICGICGEEMVYEVAVLPCGHRFCKSCIVNSLEGSSTGECPVCGKTFINPDFTICTKCGRLHHKQINHDCDFLEKDPTIYTCQFAEFGCTFRGNKEEMLAHNCVWTRIRGLIYEVKALEKLANYQRAEIDKHKKRLEVLKKLSEQMKLKKRKAEKIESILGLKTSLEFVCVNCGKTFDAKEQLNGVKSCVYHPGKYSPILNRYTCCNEKMDESEGCMRAYHIPKADIDSQI